MDGKLEVTRTCAGCGKDLPSYHSRVEVELAPDAKRHVCKSGNGGGVKESCREAARQKLRLCGGCGREMASHRWRRYQCCDECVAAVRRDRAAKPPSELVWVGIDIYALHGTSSDLGFLTDMLARCLGESVGRWQASRPKEAEGGIDHVFPSGGYYSTYGRRADVFVEVRRDRLEALQWALECVRAIAQHSYAIGVERGHNLLGRLASGETTIKDYDQNLRGERR